jgi:hypothetical protein
MVRLPPIVVALLLALVVSCAGLADGAVAVGTPYVQATVSYPAAGWNATAVQASIISFWRNHASSTLRAYGTALSTTSVFVVDVNNSSVTSQANFSTYVSLTGLTAVNAFTAMRTLSSLLVQALPSGYGVVSSQAVENPPASGKFSLAAMGTVYKTQWSDTLTLSLSVPAQYGKTLALNIRPVETSLATDVPTLYFPYPTTSQTFKIRAGTSLVLSGVIISINTTLTTDPTSRWSADTSALFNTIRVLDFDRMTAVPLDSTARLYVQRTSANFYIRALANRKSSFSAVVTVVTSPANVLTVTPTNVTITQASVDYPFTIRGPVGTYTISYLIPPPWNIGSTVVAPANADYYALTTSSTITILPLMNVSVTHPRDGYILAAPLGTYGGALSFPFTLTLSELPVSSVTITVVSTSSDVTATPSAVTISSTGSRIQQFTLRGLTAGVKPLSFVLSGADSGNYNPTPLRTWTVHGTNPACADAGTTQSSCLAYNGCAWNALNATCQNTTLPILLSEIPLLFHGQPSENITLTLPTAVRESLTITFVASARLAFSPASITLGPGRTQANFSITGTMKSSDPKEAVAQTFQMLLSGADQNYFTQQWAVASVRPKISCRIKAPGFSMFVLTLSHLYTLECDGPPQYEVWFKSTTNAVGVDFVPVEPQAGRDQHTLYFSPLNTTQSFYINSTALRTYDKVGSDGVAITLTTGGRDALRFNDVSAAYVRIMASALVMPPPRFNMTQYTTSADLHVDLTYPPSTPLNITITIIDNVTLEVIPLDLVAPHPRVLTFNNSQRGTFTISGNITGFFAIVLNLTGEEVSHYTQPPLSARVPFGIRDPLDGSVFKARSSLGYYGGPLKRSCRVAAGWRSRHFDGQDAVDFSGVCADVPVIAPASEDGDTSGDYNCSQWVTKERCVYALSKLGHACAWANETCLFVREMEGRFQQYAFGSQFVYFLDTNGSVWSIGDPTYGQLGHTKQAELGPVGVPCEVATVAAGQNFGLALCTNGDLYAWGINSRGQLGIGTIEATRSTPTLVTFPRGENATCISAGTQHAAAISVTGNLFLWGSNFYGQLGNDATYRTWSTGPVLLPRARVGAADVVAVQCEEYHTVVATSTTAFTFGSNTMGQLGRTGYDEVYPGQPVLYKKSDYVSAPTYASYIRCG